MSATGMGTDEEKRPGFFATWLSFTFHPGRAYSKPADQRSSWSPLGFAMIVVALARAIGGAGEQLVLGEGTEAGNVDWSRFWLKTHGNPVLPLGTTPPLDQNVAECLRKRPSRAEATPPRR